MPSDATSTPWSVHQAFDTGGEQFRPLLGLLAAGWIGMLRGPVGSGGVEIQQAPHGLDSGSHVEQHPPHIGVLVDRGLGTAFSVGAATLAALGGEGGRLLIGPLGYGQAFKAHQEAGLVHHGEHLAHPLVLFAHQLTDRPVKFHYAGGAGVDADLVLQPDAADGIALAHAAVAVHQVFGGR